MEQPIYEIKPISDPDSHISNTNSLYTSPTMTTYIISYNSALFYLIFLLNLNWFAHGVFNARIGCIFILYTLIEFVFDLSVIDICITTFILVRKINSMY
jgi:hypothetical protein